MRTGLWAKASLISPNGQILLLRRSETDPQRPGDWDFAGGNIEPGEDIVAGLLREIAEEVGMHLQPDDVQLTFAATDLYDELSVTRLFL